MKDPKLNVTRGNALLLYAISKASYTIRFILRLDRKIDPSLLRKALDQTARRYPYFCVTLKKNDKEFYYEENPKPVALLHTGERITLGTEETNGHIWAVCYDEDKLFLDFYHGRADGAGVYPVLATLLYYYFEEQYGLKDSSGIRTLDEGITEKELHDPVEDLPVIDLSAVKIPPLPKALNLMETSGIKRAEGKGRVFKLMIPEESFLPFTKANDASPGIMLCALMTRAIERVHPEHADPLICSYVVNGRPMLHAEESFHNCTNRVLLHYDEKIRNMPLDRQCTSFRGKTILQADEEAVRQRMTVSGSLAQRVLDAPDITSKVEMAAKIIHSSFSASSFVVSYVGKWKQGQLGEHIKEFWTETPSGLFPVIEIGAVGGKIFVSLLQSFEETLYYQALVEELQANGIDFVQCGDEPISVADIVV
ncbi:MAG: hypothetical protein K5770_20870 [Lachnospiraceae bacterium]|nr:hypothetical protein [Lachnospiraceae bacterium]